MTTLQAFPTARRTRNALPLDIHRVHIAIVNAFLVGRPGSNHWTLVDAGLPHSAGWILAAAEKRFGAAPPAAIILSHGHFDHVGALDTLLERWPGVMVYAHELELPYLTGKSDYPPPDPTVGGGLMARMSPLYPRKAIDLGDRVMGLPTDGSVPTLPGWRWVATPGHSPGHVSFFRESDRVLLAADAFSTQKQESMLGALSEFPVVEGPPAYFTVDWQAAGQSVRALAALRPAVAAPGHGLPMGGSELAARLGWLAENFERVAVPSHGRYVDAPVIADRSGMIVVPPPVPDPWPKVATGLALSAAGLLAWTLLKPSGKK